MRVTIYQPQYFPRLHYFNRILNSDVYVIFDSPQYVKSLIHIEADGSKKKHRSFVADTVIKSDLGKQYLTIPVKHQGKRLPIRKKAIDYTHDWTRNHLLAIKFAYSKAPFFNQMFAEIEELLSKKYNSLAEMNIKTTLWGITRVLGIEFSMSNLTLNRVNQRLAKMKNVPLKRVLRDQETGVVRPPGQQKGTQWTAAICKSLKATQYHYGGTAGTGYMDLDYYKKLGITPVVQNWQCMEHIQQFSDKHGFIANLSIIDLLLNVEHRSAYDIILPDN